MNMAFVCWRPYQILNVLNLITHNVEDISENDTLDLYIKNLPSILVLREYLENSGIFSNIYLFCDPEKSHNPFKRNEFLRPEKNIKIVCPDASEKNFVGKYNKIFSAGWDRFAVKLINVNPYAEVILYEEGTANYIRDFIPGFSNAQKFKFYFLNKFHNKGPFAVHVSSMYVYAPELMLVKRKYPVYKMPEADSKFYRFLCRTFDYSPEKDKFYSGKSIVYLDQPDKHDLSFIFYLSNINNFVFRTHPAEKTAFRYILHPYQDTGFQMWELIAGKFTDETVLISDFSTGQFTPNTFYGKCPTLIFLYRINKRTKKSDKRQMKKLVKRFKKNYDGKIYEPKTCSEFLKLLKK